MQPQAVHSNLSVTACLIKVYACICFRVCYKILSAKSSWMQPQAVHSNLVLQLGSLKYMPVYALEYVLIFWCLIEYLIEPK